VEHTILVTGASGYLGSAISVDLARDHRVIGICRRQPNRRQQQAAPGALWEKSEIIDVDCIESVLKRQARRGPRVDVILHFAAFTDYDDKWQDEYCDTNVIGTRNIIEAADRCGGVRRIVFAGSIAALTPPGPGEALTEQSPAGGRVAYCQSKAMGEALMTENVARVPAIILRIGGVFTDWCELPPLFSLMNAWSLPFPLGRIVPGSGRTGFPYIHRRDIVGIVRRIIEKHEQLSRLETFFAAPRGCTTHAELFPAIRRALNRECATRPIRIPPRLARMMLHGKYAVNTLMGRETYERPWMIDYVDRPLVVDTRYTQRRLEWAPTPGLHVLERIPVLMHHFNTCRAEWRARNIRRNDQKYEFEPDPVP
jgi:nucleoside-diphosphate-sugar epimerase